MTEATPEEPKGKRTKVPPPEDPKPSTEAKAEAEKSEPRAISGNAELHFNHDPAEISGSINTLATSGGVRLIRFNLKAEVEGDPLCEGVGGASAELERASQVVDEGTYTNAMTIGRDWRAQRYVIDPDGAGKGVEFVGVVVGSLSVSVNRKGKVSASWKVETKVPIADFDRLAELSGTLLRLTTHTIQGSLVEGSNGQLEIH